MPIDAAAVLGIWLLLIVVPAVASLAFWIGRRAERRSSRVDARRAYDRGLLHGRLSERAEGHWS